MILMNEGFTCKRFVTVDKRTALDNSDCPSNGQKNVNIL